MQGPAIYSNIPPAQQGQQGQQHVPGHVWNRLVYFILPVVMVVLVGGSMFWLQWASQRSLALGYPTPHASMFTSAANNTVQVRNAIQFTAASPGRGLTYSWDFGDNSYGDGVSITHSYQSGGTYTVSVTVTDALNQSSTTSQRVTVSVPPPQAAFTYTNNGYGTINFDASGSSADPSTSLTTYSWDFGDGGTDSTSSAQDYHNYSNYGTYSVTLTVTDGTGQTSQVTNTINV